jgi:hypothetical protein
MDPTRTLGPATICPIDPACVFNHGLLECPHERDQIFAPCAGTSTT